MDALLDRFCLLITRSTAEAIETENTDFMVSSLASANPGDELSSSQVM